MNYKLLAADMDGTLLNSQKVISEGDVSAINKAFDAGKEVIFSTGRCIAELKPFFSLFPKMRYVLCESGACLYDLKEQKAIYRRSLDAESARTIMEYAFTQDLMPQVLTEDCSVMNRADIDNLPHFFMEHYYDHFIQTGRLVPSVEAVCQEVGYVMDKICLYHASAEERAKTAEFIQSRGIPVVLALAEKTSLEVSPEGINKGGSLKRLCAHLGIDISEVIGVGDSYNDLSMLRTVGLPAAMGNAVEAVKEVCDVVVADNDHCGVAEAVGFLMHNAQCTVHN